MTRAKKVVRKYIEMALRERIDKQCPHYSVPMKEAVIEASMENLDVSKPVLYRAIELAAHPASLTMQIKAELKSGAS